MTIGDEEKQEQTLIQGGVRNWRGVISNNFLFKLAKLRNLQ